jgi:hypothetical protein
MGPTCTPSDGVVLAIDHLDFGESNTWQGLGFNLDGKVSTPASTDLCKPVSGGSKATAYPDGNNGIDNSFGRNIIPVLSQAGSVSGTSNGNIAMGVFTVMFDFVGLTAAADQTGVTTRLYSGTALGMAPAFDGSDCWPVAPELLSTPTDITSSTIVFSQSAVAGNVWTSGAPTTLKLTIPFLGGAVINLTLHQAQVSLTFAADHKSATAGLLGGVLDTEEFIAEVNKAAAALGVCALIAPVEPQLRQASDIMNDGTQDPTQTCNGISIGIGFTMKNVQLGGVGPATPPNTMTCP